MFEYHRGEGLVSEAESERRIDVMINSWFRQAKIERLLKSKRFKIKVIKHGLR